MGDLQGLRGKPLRTGGGVCRGVGQSPPRGPRACCSSPRCTSDAVPDGAPAAAWISSSSERIHTVATWRETPYFNDAERATLALTEAATRLADRPDPVPDEVWDEAARHYTEPQLAALVVAIAAINAFNRLNVATGQLTGGFVDQVARAAAPQPA